MSTVHWPPSFQQEIRASLLPWMLSRLRVDRQTASDLLQYGALQLIKEFQGNTKPENPVAWMRTVIQRKWIDHLRKIETRNTTSLNESDDDSFSLQDTLESDWPDAYELLQDADVRECVQRQLDNLASERGSVMALALRLSVLDELSTEELTVVLERKSAGATRVFLHKCRQYARSYLSECWALVND